MEPKTLNPEPKHDDKHSAVQKETPEQRAARVGTRTGKPAGDINVHAPVGPIVGEVFKSREDLQKPKTQSAPGVLVPPGPCASLSDR